MAHGYLGDGYGMHGEMDPDREDRERGWRDRDRDERGRRSDTGEQRREHSRDHGRDRGMMFGGRQREWSGEDRWSGRGSGRQEYDREQDYGDYAQGRRSFSANPDDHYRSWRDRHMSELDRDYEDYCREREQQFHQDFDSWRRQRQGNPQPLQTGMTQTGMSHDPSGELQLTTEATPDQGGTDPMGEATLGTNSSSEGRTGRGRR